MENTENDAQVLIVYGTKQGGTEECAALVAQGLRADTVVYNCKSKAEAQLDKFLYVIIGTPLYLGKILPEVDAFCKKHQKALAEKKLAFFTCGIGLAEEDEAYLRQSLPSSLLAKPALISHFGGVARYEKMSRFEQVVLRGALIKQKRTPSISREAIRAFCLALNSRWFG